MLGFPDGKINSTQFRQADKADCAYNRIICLHATPSVFILQIGIKNVLLHNCDIQHFNLLNPFN